nr:FAD-dependent hydroxylase [Alphaproteobacteria bacterium]
FINRRFALVGDAAVGMHPVTAHGFNFGLKGQHILSKLLKEALQSGLDIGEDGMLSRYQSLYRRATLPLYITTNKIVGLYTSDSQPAKVIRKMLLNVANQVVPVKNYLMDKLIEKDDLSPKFSSPLGIRRKLLQLLP